MKTLPPSPDLAHLKKQAKRLLKDARAGNPDAALRFLAALPAVRGGDAAGLAEAPLKLHDAQSVVAREYGFRSWVELRRYVAWTRSGAAERLRTWWTWVLEGNARDRRLAVRMLREEPGLFAGDRWLACAIGDEAVVAKAVAAEPGFVAQRGGAFAMEPLAIVSHSKLILEDGFEAGLMASAALLLKHGADVDGTWEDARWPGNPLSVLYGAAGRTHHAGMTRLLLAAGANPDDNESLYHAVEAPDDTCARLLLGAGARVRGTNAIGRALDYDRPETLRLLLAHGGDAAEAPWIHHAILRGRSLAHIRMLAEAGADLRATNEAGVSVYRWASLNGRTDVLALLAASGVAEPLSDEEAFVAACARGDQAAAEAIKARIPDILARLQDWQLESLPQRASVGDAVAVRTMLALGWPREVKSGWQATALNLAVFQGDAAMARRLLAAGADWRTEHGFKDTVLGTLSFASRSEDVGDPAPRDYVGCAAALADHGVPGEAFQRYGFSDDVADFLDARFGGSDPG